MNIYPERKKEVAEAVIQGVLIAALSAISTGLINWKIEQLKAKAAKDAEGKKEPEG